MESLELKGKHDLLSVQHGTTRNIYKVSNLLGEKYQAQVFMAQHFVITFCSSIIWYFTLGNVLALTLLGALTLLSTLHNSAGYYMEVFAKKYNSELEELDKLSKEASEG